MAINTNKLNFLRFRDKVLNIDALEAEYNIQLPPTYKAFITTFIPYFPNILFDPGTDGEKHNFVFPIYFWGASEQTFTYDDNSICPMDFKEVEDLLNVQEEDMYAGWERDLIYIADHSYYGGLMLGIQEHNADKIYHQDGGPLVFVANNIFEFLQGIYYAKDLDHFPDLDLSRLYRNWDEDFWRIRRSTNKDTDS